MKLIRIIFISVGALLAVSCSKAPDSRAAEQAGKPPQAVANDHKEAAGSATTEEEEEREENVLQPNKDDVIEDCHAFVGLTRIVTARAGKTDCPECPPNEESKPALRFEGAKVEHVSCAGETCEVAMSIRASFIPGNNGTINGGLTGWIPVDQREQYARGQTPHGEQAYKVKITYRKEGSTWRLVDFDRG